MLTHFIVAADVARSRDFYVEVLGGSVVLDGEPTIVKLANGWVIINVGGGPTDDKPSVVLEPPTEHRRTNAFPEHPRGRYPGHLSGVTLQGLSSSPRGTRPRAPLLHARPRRPLDRVGQTTGALPDR